MFTFSKPLDLPPQLRWKFAHEPELLQWAIRARDYNTFVANCMFLFMSVVLAGLTYALYSPPGPNETYLTKILVSLGFYTTLSLVLLSVTHQRMNFAYRITQSGVEYCRWKDFPKWALTFLKWFTPLTAIIFIFLATLDPAFLIGALVGPGGMALTYLAMANSQSYREMRTEYHHHQFVWEEFTQLAIATNREVVDLKFRVILDGNDYITHGNHNIFCERGKKTLVANLIKSYLPANVPFIRAKVDVPMSTD